MPVLKRLNPNGKYQILGITGYTLIGSAFVFNFIAKSNFDKYQDEFGSITLRENYYSKTNTFKSFKNICIFSAIGIWAVDYIWLFLKKIEMNKKYSFYNNRNKLQIGASYNIYANKPMLNFRFYF